LSRYSELDGLDADALEAQVLSASEATVLLLATAASSYLWFDPEYCPRNVELCTILKNFPHIRVNFVVCPTTNSARDGWQQHQPDLRRVFGRFLPGRRRLHTWTDFDPEQDLGQVQIRSLIYQARIPPRFNHEGFHAQLGMGLVWRSFVKLLVLILLVALGLRPVILQHEGQLREIQELRNQILSMDETIDKMTTQTEAKYKMHNSKMEELESRFQSHAFTR
jgi:hypothetical protein